MKKRVICIVIVLLLIAVAALAFWEIPEGIGLYRMLRDFWGKEAACLDVELESEEFGALQMELDWVDIDGRRIIRLGQGGVSVYYCDGVIYLENGKGYDFGDALPDGAEMLEQPWKLLPLVEMDHSDGVWAVQLDTGEVLREIDAVELVLEEGELGLTNLNFQVREIYNEPYSISGSVVVRDRPGMTVPQPVRDAISSGEVQGGQDLTQSLLRLMEGWARLNARDPLAMTLELSADCGPVDIGDTLLLYRTAVEDTPISYVEKGSLGLYFTENMVCTADGRVVTSQESAVEAAQLLGLVYPLCFYGELECSGDVFRLSLDQQAMESLAYAIAPQVQSMNVGLTEGVLELTMEDDAIGKIRIHCGGTVDVLLTRLDVSIGAVLEFVEGETDFTVPDAVMQALLG